MVVRRRVTGAAAIVATGLLCAWLMLPWTAAAQDASTDASTPRRILVAVEKGFLAGFSDDDLGILERSFLTTLSAAEGAPSALAFGNGQFPSRPADREKAARDRGADAWLLLTVGGGAARPVLSVSSYDLIYQVTTLSFTVNRREPFPIMDIDRELWGDVVPRIVAAYPAILPSAYNRGALSPAAVTIRALPGTVVSGLSPKPVVVGKDGTASLQLPSPLPYSLRATLGGYIPVSQSIYFHGQPEITIPQARSPWLLVDFTLLDGFFPGVSGTLASSPFPGFVRLGFTTFRAGIAINQDNALVSIPLSQLTLHLGLYLASEDKPLRGYVGAGGLVRLSLPPGGELTVDALMPWGVQVIIGMEIAFSSKLRSFVELSPSFYSMPLPGLFMAYFKDTGFPYIPIGSVGVLDPVELRLGLRWVP
jgi:hypothetical protein